MFSKSLRPVFAAAALIAGFFFSGTTLAQDCKGLTPAQCASIRKVQPNWGFDLMVKGVAPANGLIEHQPIRVNFQLDVTKNLYGGEPPPMAVRVCPEDNKGTCFPIPSVAARSYSSAIDAYAPTAGATAPVRIKVVTSNCAPNTECYEETLLANAEQGYPVAARYDISIDSYTIINTRAKIDDTVRVSLRSAKGGEDANSLCSLVGGAYCIHLRNEGDQRGSGTYPVGDVRVGTFQLIPEVDPDIGFEYDFMNLGQPYAERAFKIVFDFKSDLAAGILNAVMQGGSFSGLNDIAHKIHGLGGCDGLIALDARRLVNKTDPNLTAPTLDTLTRNAGRYTETKDDFDEIETQNGCGHSPKYTVTWSVIRTSWQQP